VRYFRGRDFRKALFERLTDPIHLNIAAAFVNVFGSYPTKVAFDLIPRPAYAFGMLKAAELAGNSGVTKITALEFGVASGAGLLAMCRLAEETTRCTGVQFNIVGFDSGAGLPPPVDYRDHPDLWIAGDYPMPDREALLKSLPPNARLIIGPIAETVPGFLDSLSADSPLGFVSIDVDYYSSAKDALTIFAHADPNRYLHLAVVYMDDIMEETSNSWSGELLAIREFNEAHELRKLEVDRPLRQQRIFKNASWLEQIYLLHVLDHPRMRPGASKRSMVIQLPNEQLGIEEISPYKRKR
jgi:hypothetical protein